ncbi:MAG: conjugative transfer system coupling protein TraD [Methylothermaceae bacterium]|nr:conjugative transfer system coupling protein TraD [Methylothermaceae bacterium]
MTKPIDTYRRGNYEAIAAAGWLLTVLYAVLGWLYFDLPGLPFQTAAVIGAVLLVARGLPALDFHVKKRRLSVSDKVDVLKLEQLIKIRERNPADIYVGMGFDWGQPHTQKVFDILKGDIDAVAPRRSGQMGSPWVHSLGDSDSPIPLPLTHSEGHTFIIGTTGAGKTTLFRLLIAQAILRNEAVVIFDPKGDQGLRKIAQATCEHLGNPDRFVYFHPAFPEESTGIDALHNFNRPSELSSRLAALIPSETGADPFKAFGQKSLDNIVQGVLTLERRPNLVSLRRYLEAGAAGLVVRTLSQHLDRVEPTWRDRIRMPRGIESVASAMVRFYRERVQERFPALNLEGLLSLYEHDRAHFNKMVASLLPVMNILTSGDLATLLSPGLDEDRTYSNLAKIIRQNQVAYIGLDSLSDSMTGAAVGSLLLSDLASVAGDRYNYEIGDRTINIFVDEAAEVVNDPFIQVLNKGRGAGMRLFVATQTFSDFVARMGSKDKAQQILGNMNNLISLRVLDADTQKYVTGNLPQTYIKYVMQVQGSSTNSDEPAVYTGSVSERLMEEEVDMAPPQLLGMLPNFHYFAKLSGNRIVKGRLPILEA